MGVKKTKRVSRQEWLAAALAALQAGGVESVRVERLARTIGISKSGFYWHFKNRADLLDQLLDVWETEYTKIVASDPRAGKGTPEQRLLRVMRMVETGNLAGYDSVFQIWASKDELARQAFNRVMRRREDFVSSIIHELGFEGEELEMLTMLFVLYVSGEGQIFSFKSKRKREKMRRRILTLICEK